MRPEGRITYADVGLWDDATEAAMARVLESVRRWSDMPIAIQLAHAGRKASTDLPWKGGAQIAPESRQWLADRRALRRSPSRRRTTRADRARRGRPRRVRDAFAAAAKRAARLGLDAIQLHGAHGYLLHQFLSPLSNRRDDDYGGSLENRMRFPLEVFDAVRAAFPAGRPVTVRVSGTDWVEGGWDIEQTIAFAQALEARGCSGHPRLQRRPRSAPGNSGRPELSGAARPRGQGGGQHARRRGRPDHRARAGRGDRRRPATPTWSRSPAPFSTIRAGRGTPPPHLGAQVQAPDQYLRSQPRQYSKLFAPAATS